MKRSLYLLLSVLTAFVLTFALTACDSDDENDGKCKNHVYSEEYKVTENGHEYACKNSGCDAVRVDSHYFGSTVTVTDPTCTKLGVGERTCITCEYTYEVPVEMAPHTYEKTYTSDETNHWRKCENCDAKISVTEHKFIVHGHDNENHWYTCECGAKGNISAHTWSDEHHTDGTMTRTCTEPTCGLVLSRVDDPNHECTYTKGEITKQPTCTETGIQELVCECGGKSSESIPMIPHSYTHGNYIINDTYHWQNCECGAEPNVADMIPHKYGNDPVQEGDYNVYTCECGHQKKEPATGYIDPEGWT